MNSRKPKLTNRVVIRLILLLAIGILAAPQLYGSAQETPDCLRRTGNGELCEYCVTPVEDGHCWSLVCCPIGGDGDEECQGDYGGTGENCPDAEEGEGGGGTH